MLEDFLINAIDQVIPQGITHVGFIGGNKNGEFALARPHASAWGTSATFAKERIEKGEQASRALLRCLTQYQNPTIEGIYPVPQVWATPNSVTFFFAGWISGGGEKIWATDKGEMGWGDSTHCRKLLQASGNKLSRLRDLAVLDMVDAMCLSPYHRVLLMVRELHLLGFEQLRAPAYDYPIAWRCPIVPACWTLKSHGGMYKDLRTDSAPLQANRKCGVSELHFTYSSAQKQRPFGWTDVAFDSPKELASRFLREFPNIAALGWGPDKPYTEWFNRLLPELLRPYRSYAAFGEYNGPADYLYRSDGAQLPLPPPGMLDADDTNRFMNQFNRETDS